MKTRPSLTLMIATGVYSGYLPVVPGTFGTVVGLLPAFALSRIDHVAISLVLLGLSILLAVWTAGRAEQKIGGKDPGCIVIDEIAGVMTALWGLPFTWLPVTVGFVVFRCLDMAKPFPIRQLDRNLSGGSGIVADDIAAGIITNIILRLIF